MVIALPNESSSPSAGPTVGGYRCVSCGYGTAVAPPPTECPMCRGRVWDPEMWAPFSSQRVHLPLHR
jgi:rubrerythrin